MTRHIRSLALAAFGAMALFAAPHTAQAQDAHKPGGLTAVAHNVSNTFKRAGRDTKAEVRRDEVKAHHGLQDAGNETKTVLKRTTGIHGSNNTHPGGLNKIARDISHAGKSVGRSARDEKDKIKSSAHGTATKAGNETKTEIKRATP